MSLTFVHSEMVPALDLKRITSLRLLERRKRFPQGCMHILLSNTFRWYFICQWLGFETARREFVVVAALFRLVTSAAQFFA